MVDDLFRAEWQATQGSNKAQVLWGDTGGRRGKELLTISRSQFRLLVVLVIEYGV